MQMSHPVQDRSWIARMLLVLSLLSLLILTSACSGDARMRQNALTSQAHLNQALQHARQLGVPETLLQPVLQKEQQLQANSAPFNLFSDQPANDYYHNLDVRYTQLAASVPRLIANATTQTRTQAQHDLSSMQTTLDHLQDLPTDGFNRQLKQAQAPLPHAQTPGDYVRIDTNVQTIGQAVNQLLILKGALSLLRGANFDVTGLNVLYQSDLQRAVHMKSMQDLQQLNAQLQLHNQEVTVNLFQIAPQITAARLNNLNQQISLLAAQGIDPTAYKQRMAADKAMLGSHMSLAGYLAFTNQVDADTSEVQIKLLRAEAPTLISKFHHEATAWGNAHLYHDSFNNQAYPLDAGYLSQGIGSDLDAAFAQASSLSDLQDVVTTASNALFNLKMFEADAADSTPYNRVHNTDLQMISHYHLGTGQVVMVSLAQQAMRIYQNGKLVQAFEVTTGRPELPSLPGLWSPLARLSPTIFKSGEPVTSPYWYPDTPIHYAILYHAGGYFIHDSWWRDTYGPGTQFPHADASGNQSFAGDGSHGCINMQENEAAWVYDNTSWQTQIVIY